MGEDGMDGLPFRLQISLSEATTYYLLYTNFLSLSDKELVIVSAVIPGSASGKQREITNPSLIGNIHLDPIWKYFSRRNFLKLVLPDKFLLWGLNLTQDNLKMKCPEP